MKNAPKTNARSWLTVAAFALSTIMLPIACDDAGPVRLDPALQAPAPELAPG